MNGAERIKDKIMADARALHGKILEDARLEAKKIVDEAEKEAFKMISAMTEKANEEALQIKKRLRAVSGLEDRKKNLKARQDAVDEAFSAAIARIANLPDSQYASFIEGLLLKTAREDSGELVLNERDKARLGNGFITRINTIFKEQGRKAVLSLSKDDLKAQGGFIIRYGDMEINSTLEILLSVARPGLEAEVAAILFGK